MRIPFCIYRGRWDTFIAYLGPLFYIYGRPDPRKPAPRLGSGASSLYLGALVLHVIALNELPNVFISST